jgi:glucose-6-phosphate isomerase
MERVSRGGADTLPEWQRLRAHCDATRHLQLRELFEADPQRGQRLTVEAAGLYCDYSKNLVTEETIDALIALARARALNEEIEAMFAGKPVNATEGRPALHVALRMPRDRSIIVSGVDVVAEVHEVLDRMSALAERLRGGGLAGSTGTPIRTVVNIGIGGSNLGPQMANRALSTYATSPIEVRFVANVDPSALSSALADLDPAATMFILSSKSFRTLETVTNGRAARDWLTARIAVEGALRQHLVAVTADAAAAAEMGIDPAHVFPIWDWVGGRYSMDSAIGLATMIAIGPDRFREMLGGFQAMDEHFRTAPWRGNMPVLMGLLTFWYATFRSAAAIAVLPYSHRLRRFPAYLQQLTMESNGKRVTSGGEVVTYDTGPIYWGEPGTEGQHSFYQLLHQGTRLVPCDFIVVARADDPIGDQQDLLVANALAQSAALAFGISAEALRASGVEERLIPHRVCPGNRPSTTLLIERLTPAALGALVALYEHSVFTQAVLWGTDPFDQWGVELGKRLADGIRSDLAQGAAGDRDSSTAELIRRYRLWRPPQGGP